MNPTQEVQPRIRPEENEAQLALQSLNEFRTSRLTFSISDKASTTVPSFVENNPILWVRMANDEQSSFRSFIYTKGRGFISNNMPLVARTSLGRRLLLLRQKIVESGVKLLDWDEVIIESRERRGD